MLAQEVTLQLAEAASQAAVLQLTAAMQAARLLKLKMREVTLQLAEAASLAAVLQLMAAMLAARLLQMKMKEVRSAMPSSCLLPVCWTCRPLSGARLLQRVEAALKDT